MKAKIVICDVYGTLVEVGPEPVDRDERWRELHRRWFGRLPERDWETHRLALKAEVDRSRDLSKSRGVPVPEVVWEDIVGAVLPAWRLLERADRAAFLVDQAGLTHQLRLYPGVADVLRRWRREGVVLGIASNAQPYSEAELSRELATAGLGMDLFEPELQVWSWRQGFSKPDPHVFRILDVRVRRWGVAPGEVLMIGDREDNDMVPARAWGWQTWRLEPGPAREGGGDWSALTAWWWG